MLMPFGNTTHPAEDNEKCKLRDKTFGIFNG